MKIIPDGVRTVPKPTRFTYPDGKRIKGEVIKEVGKVRKGIVAGDYYFVIQLIKYPKDNEKYVRFGYYKKDVGEEKYKWVRNGSYHCSIEFTRELIKEAEKEGIL